MTDKGLKISYHIIHPWRIFPCNTMALCYEVDSMSEMPQFHYSMANGERKSFIDPGVYISKRQFRLLLCNKLIGCKLCFAYCNIRPLPCSFDHALLTLVFTLDWFLMMTSRGCCEVSLPEKRKENLVETALDYRPWPPPIHSAAFCTSNSRSKVNRKERSPQLVDCWEKLNFDGVFPWSIAPV